MRAKLRTVVFQICLSPAEMEAIRQAAGHEAVSAWIRRIILAEAERTERERAQ